MYPDFDSLEIYLYLCRHIQYIQIMIEIRIKEVAKEHGMSLTDVFKKTQYQSLPSFYRQINNPESLNMKTLVRIADAIGCEVGEFFVSSHQHDESKDSHLVCPHCGKELHIKIE